MKKLFLLLLIPVLLQAYTYSAFNGPLGKSNLCATLMTSGYAPDAMLADIYVGYGFTDKFDVFANLANLGPTADIAYNGSLVMPRYALTANHVAACMVGRLADNTFWYAPQYHFFYETDRWSFEGNLGFYSENNPYYIEATGGAVLGLVYKAGKYASPYVEFDPWYNSAFDFVVSPGVYLSLPGTPHSVSLSFPITSGGDVGVYAWYSFFVSLK